MISVVIPAFNASKTIDSAISSVLTQSLRPDQILVADDGSTDDTFCHLLAYQGKISLFRHDNQGVAFTRNFLCNQANGDLIAFLDADDVWHPHYLRTQNEIFTKFPEIAASFTGHVNFFGFGSYEWKNFKTYIFQEPVLLEPLDFFKKYNRLTGAFGSPSFFCIPKKILSLMGPSPFPISISGADDFFLANSLTFYGPVAFTNAALVAYRETPGSISSNRLKSVGLALDAFGLLEKNVIKHAIIGRKIEKEFYIARSAKRREYARILMGIGDIKNARRQFAAAIKNSGNFASVAKSICFFVATYLPKFIQPHWPHHER
jgi:glycosyltransferase involved in cell wall biosynthesis